MSFGDELRQANQSGELLLKQKQIKELKEHFSKIILPTKEELLTLAKNGSKTYKIYIGEYQSSLTHTEVRQYFTSVHGDKLFAELPFYFSFSDRTNTYSVRVDWDK